jgi:hypothetical protein
MNIKTAGARMNVDVNGTHGKSLSDLRLQPWIRLTVAVKSLSFAGDGGEQPRHGQSAVR